MAKFTFFFAVAFLLVSVLAWTGEDHEIFRLRDEVITSDGPNVTFYDLVGITPSASQSEIAAALKKKSKRLHPDKAIPSMLAQLSRPKPASKGDNKKPGVHVQKGPTQKQRAQVTKEANERYARLSNVARVLQGPARVRYDHFLKNGFPVWKGTGYYYARFRPGLGTVLIGLLVVFGGAAHYGAMYISWKRQRDFVQRYVSHARETAWGNGAGVPGVPGLEGVGSTPPGSHTPPEEDFAGPLNRRQKRAQEKESKKKDTSRAAKSARANGISRPVDGEPLTGPQGSRKKVVAENGKVLIVDSVGDVFLEETTEEGEVQEYLLDPDEIPKPTIMQTAMFRLPIWVFTQTIGRGIDKLTGTSEMQETKFLDREGLDLTTDHSPTSEDAIQTATSLNRHEEIKKRKSKSKAKA